MGKRECLAENLAESSLVASRQKLSQVHASVLTHDSPGGAEEVLASLIFVSVETGPGCQEAKRG